MKCYSHDILVHGPNGVSASTFCLSLLILTGFLTKEESIHNEVCNSVGVVNESHVKAFKRDSCY